MIKPPSMLQDLQRKMHAKATAEPSWRPWGLYTHICKMECLRAAYAMATHNNGAPGIDGVTFQAIAAAGAEAFLEQLRNELITFTYQPLRNRRQPIPKNSGKMRVLSIPAIRDRVVQGSVKVILEPVFEADFQAGSFGYRPNQKAHAAINRVANAIVEHKTRVIDLDLRAFFDNVQHHRLLHMIAARLNDDDVMHLLKMMLAASGKRGVPQGAVISPLLSNIYLTPVDRMLEHMKEVTCHGKYTALEYARFADDLVILVDGDPRHDWLVREVNERVREKFTKLGVEVNEAKTRLVNLAEGEDFRFLGFQFRRVRGFKGTWGPQYAPTLKKQTELLRKLTDIFRHSHAQPVEQVVEQINPILRGWVNYFAIGHSERCFAYIRDWVERQIWQHLLRNQPHCDMNWCQRREWLYGTLGLFGDYRVKYYPAREAEQSHSGSP